jgi:hypothetical protein
MNFKSDTINALYYGRVATAEQTKTGAETKLKEKIIIEIINKYGNSNRGCYINNNWLSVDEIIKIIQSVK